MTDRAGWWLSWSSCLSRRADHRVNVGITVPEAEADDRIRPERTRREVIRQVAGQAPRVAVRFDDAADLARRQDVQVTLERSDEFHAYPPATPNAAAAALASSPLNPKPM
jgi:hypothetical protein